MNHDDLKDSYFLFDRFYISKLVVVFVMFYLDPCYQVFWSCFEVRVLVTFTSQA